MKLKLGQLLSVGEEAVQIIGQKIPMKNKYWLGRLINRVESEQKSFNKLRDEAIQELGTKNENGQYEVKAKTKSGKDNAKFKKFQDQIMEVLEQNIEVDIDKFPLSMFDNVESEAYFPVFFELFVDEEK